MTEQNPATPAAAPAAAAAPGAEPNVITTPSTAPAGTVPEGKVTIETKEYAQLQRDAARGRSAQKRADLRRGQAASNKDGGNTDVNAAIADAEDRAAEAEQRALQSDVRAGIRDLLEKDEFKNIPRSTRELILKNPAALSKAETLDEAMLDIEDYLRDQVIPLDIGVTAPKAEQPAGHNTPPVVTPGGAEPRVAADLEDLSKLKGPARSQAAIRNALKSQGK